MWASKQVAAGTTANLKHIKFTFQSIKELSTNKLIDIIPVLGCTAVLKSHQCFKHSTWFEPNQCRHDVGHDVQQCHHLVPWIETPPWKSVSFRRWFLFSPQSCQTDTWFTGCNDNFDYVLRTQWLLWKVPRLSVSCHENVHLDSQESHKPFLHWSANARVGCLCIGKSIVSLGSIKGWKSSLCVCSCQHSSDRVRSIQRVCVEGNFGFRRMKMPQLNKQNHPTIPDEPVVRWCLRFLVQVGG